jgi:hypothetical protein
MPRSASRTLSSRISTADTAPRDSLLPLPGWQESGSISMIEQNLCHRIAGSEPAGGTVTSVRFSGRTTLLHRRIIAGRFCWRQKLRAMACLPRCRGDSASTYSDHVQVLRFWTSSCHIAGTARARSRAVMTASTRAG